MEMAETAVEMRGISKHFGSVVANRNVSLTIRRGEILSLLGENGSGKTTLTNMLSGIYYPDEGEILVDGKPVSIRSPRDAYDLGIGMIHQHFKLVDLFTAAENIVLGLPGRTRLNLRAVSEQILALAEQYGFHIEPDKKVYDMSVSEKQTVEIVKMLFRGAQILILDEPTAVLTPQETDRLFAVLRNMRRDGKAIVIITHKLQEVLSLSDRVSILRRGELIDTVDTKDADEMMLTEMMVGKRVVLNIDHPAPHNCEPRLEIRNLTILNQYGVKAIDDVSFDAYSGEILGIAGIAGSGQKELLEAIAGLQSAQSGSITYTGPAGAAPVELLGQNPRSIRDLGISLSFVPEDRLGMGLVGSMGVAGNMMLRSYRKGHTLLADRKTPRILAEEVIEELDVAVPNVNLSVKKLSGGNVQKVLVGRELASNPTVLMMAYAVRGLDINTSYTIYRLLNEQKVKGTAVVYVGEDLDVLLELCDRILVLCGGRVSGIVDTAVATKEQIGLLMTTLGGGDANESTEV